MIFQILQTIEDDDQRFAIEQIFNRHYKRMVRVGMKILHDKSDAEDAAMEAFRYMSQKAELFLNYESRDTLGLIYLCIRRAAVDIYRKNKRKNRIYERMEEKETVEDLPDSCEEILKILITEESKAMLFEAIQELDDLYRMPILLKYYFHMRNTEIADFIGVDVNTLNSRIFRAKQMLQKAMLRGEHKGEKSKIQ